MTAVARIQDRPELHIIRLTAPAMTVEQNYMKYFIVDSFVRYCQKLDALRGHERFLHRGHGREIDFFQILALLDLIFVTLTTPGGGGDQNY